VRGGVVVDRDAIDALRNDFAVFHDDGAERATLAREDIIEGELNGAGHERVVHVVFAHCMVAVCVAGNLRIRANGSTWTRPQPFR